MSMSRCILLDHAHIGDQHIPSSHQTSVLWHDLRITLKITNKSMHRECWVHFMHSTTHALRDVEVIELSVLVVGIPHWSKPLIQSEDLIVWKSQSSTSRHKYDVLFKKRSAGTCISFATRYNSIGSLLTPVHFHLSQQLWRPEYKAQAKQLFMASSHTWRKMYCSTRIQQSNGINDNKRNV
jgi:hypothetical protein